MGVLLDHTVKNNINEHVMLDYTARNVLCLAIDNECTASKVRRDRFSFFAQANLQLQNDH